MTDTAGNELDGDGDSNGGDDFVRTFRVDRIDAFVNGHFDCGLDAWVPVVSGDSTIEHDDLVDVDNATISGSAHFTNAAGSTELALGQCVEAHAGAVNELTGFALLVTPATSIEVLRFCEFFAAAGCSGTALPVQAFFDTISTAGAWMGFGGTMFVPPTAQSAICHATLRTAIGAPFEAFLDDFSFDLVHAPTIFADGFESGDTSAWSTTVP